MHPTPIILHTRRAHGLPLSTLNRKRPAPGATIRTLTALTVATWAALGLVVCAISQCQEDDHGTPIPAGASAPALPTTSTHAPADSYAVAF